MTFGTAGFVPFVWEQSANQGLGAVVATLPNGDNRLVNIVSFDPGIVDPEGGEPDEWIGIVTAAANQQFGPGNTTVGNSIESLGSDQQGPGFSARQAYFHSLFGPSLQIAAPGAQLGRGKLFDNNSPLPRDRFFFDYSFFNNARLASTPIDVQRFAPGFEKTFFEQNMSVEMRIPLGLTLNSTQTEGAIDANHAEFGNMIVAVKALLPNDGDYFLAGGVGIQLPTASELVFRGINGTEAIRVENNQVRLLPYLATLHTQGEWMWQNWLQADIAASGNQVYFAGQKAGTLQEQNYLAFDSSLSRWMHRDFYRGTGLALTAELHYNQSVGTADVIRMGGFNAGTPGFNASIVNATFGATYIYGKTAFTAGYGTPLTSDRGFDGELRVFVNRFF